MWRSEVQYSASSLELKLVSSTLWLLSPPMYSFKVGVKKASRYGVFLQTFSGTTSVYTSVIANPFLL